MIEISFIGGNDRYILLSHWDTEDSFHYRLENWLVFITKPWSWKLYIDTVSDKPVKISVLIKGVGFPWNIFYLNHVQLTSTKWIKVTQCCNFCPVLIFVCNYLSMKCRHILYPYFLWFSFLFTFLTSIHWGILWTIRWPPFCKFCQLALLFLN